jgi:hypothetical protein
MSRSRIFEPLDTLSKKKVNIQQRTVKNSSKEKKKIKRVTTT